MQKVVQSTLEVEYDGDTWVAEWCSFIIRDGSETTDRWLKVSRKEHDGSLTDIDTIHEDASDHRESLFQLLAAKRVQEIQAEYNIPSADFDELAISENILARVWTGEWMGQLRNSYYFFIDNLAAILGKDFVTASNIVNALNRQGKAGLNGFIIVPWEEEDDAFTSWEKSTGHKKLIVSDGHGWGCQFCGNHADERGPWASEVPCAPVDAEERRQ